MVKLNPYDLTIGQRIRVIIPEQYAPSTMYIDGVETPLMSYTSTRVITGTFEGMPKATAGFFFKSDKPIDGGLYLLSFDTVVRDEAKASDMVREAKR